MVRRTPSQRIITSLTLLAVLAYSDAWFFAFAVEQPDATVQPNPGDEKESDDQPSCGAPPIDVWSRAGGETSGQVEFAAAGAHDGTARRFEHRHTPTLGCCDHAAPELSKSVRFDPNHNIHGPPRVA